MPEIPLITGLLMAASVVTSVYAFGEFKAGRDPERFLFQPAQVMAGRNLQGMALSVFSHADTAHLAFNMFTLYFFGPVVEGEFGPRGMLAVYFASEVGALLLTMARHHHDGGYRSLGASGAISGVLFAAIVLQPTMGVYLYLIPFAIPAPLFALAYIAGSIVGAKQRLGNIGHEAHIGGAVMGFVMAALILPEGLSRLSDAVSALLH